MEKIEQIVKKLKKKAQYPFCILESCLNSKTVYSKKDNQKQNKNSSKQNNNSSKQNNNSSKQNNNSSKQNNNDYGRNKNNLE